MSSIDTFPSQPNKINYVIVGQPTPAAPHQHHPIQGSSANHHNLTNCPKDHWLMLDELKHSSTGQNQESSIIVKDPDEEYAQDANTRNAEYQHDLMDQIEDNKQEAEATRADEISEHARMNSCTHQSQLRQQLVSERHQDYRDHLTMLAQNEAAEQERKKQNKLQYENDHMEGTHQHRPIQGNSANHHNLTDNPKDHWARQDELKHSIIGSNQESVDITKDSNYEYAQDATSRNVIYQHDLKNQIEHDRQEAEAARAYDISGYPKMTRCTHQNSQRQQLVNERHQDYRDYLAKIVAYEAEEAERKQQAKLDYENDHKEPTHQHQPIQGNSANHHNLTDNPKDHWSMHDELKHSSTGQNQENAKIIKDSDEEYAQDAARRNDEYRQDLLIQIEDDKQEVESTRAHEIADHAKSANYASPTWPFSVDGIDQAAH